MTSPEPEKSALNDEAPPPSRRAGRRQFRIKTLMLIVALAGIWVWLLRSPAIAGLVVVTLGGFLAGALALTTAIFLGWAGFQVLASCDHLITSAIHAKRKPYPTDDRWT
jgi:hypothetical protein